MGTKFSNYKIPNYKVPQLQNSQVTKKARLDGIITGTSTVIIINLKLYFYNYYV